MHAWLNREIHLADQFVAIRAENWDIFEDNIISVHNFGTFSSLLQVINAFGCVFSLSWHFRLGDHDTLVLALTQVIEHLVHFVDQSRVASQILHFLVRHNQSANSLSQVDQ